MVVASACQDMSSVSGFLPLLHGHLSVVGRSGETPQRQRIFFSSSHNEHLCLYKEQFHL